MAPSRKMKIISGTTVAAIALGAGTAIAQSGTHEVELDDVVPISEVSAPDAGALDLANLVFQLDDDQDSVESPFDTSDDDESIESAEESPISVESIESEDSPDSPESEDSPDSPESEDSPDSPESDDSPDSADSDD